MRSIVGIGIIMLILIIIGIGLFYFGTNPSTSAPAKPLWSSTLVSFTPGTAGGPNVWRFSDGHLYTQYTLIGVPHDMQVGTCYSFWGDSGFSTFAPCGAGPP